MTWARVAIVFVSLYSQSVSGFNSCGGVSAPHTRLSSSRLAPLHGFLDGFLAPDPEKERKKEEAYQRQLEILAKRKANLGFIPEEDKEESRQRRAKIDRERKTLADLQKSAAEDGKDVLEDWKRLREEGTIATATQGLVRDEGSSRLGSEGLFEVRVDEKMPYLEQGYVDEKADVFGGIAKLFGGDKKAKNKAEEEKEG